MKARVRSFSSGNVDDLDTFVPTDPNNFRVDVVLEIGSEGSNGADLFGLAVGTPEWFSNRYRDEEIQPGRHYLFVWRYDWPKIKAFIVDYIESLEANTWNEMAEKIGRLAKWEYGDWGPPDLPDEEKNSAAQGPHPS